MILRHTQLRLSPSIAIPTETHPSRSTIPADTAYSAQWLLKARNTWNKNIVNTMMTKMFPAFSKFCRETSIHGWSYLSRDIHPLWKGIWTTFLLFILGVSIW